MSFGRSSSRLMARDSASPFTAAMSSSPHVKADCGVLWRGACQRKYREVAKSSRLFARAMTSESGAPFITQPNPHWHFRPRQPLDCLSWNTAPLCVPPATTIHPTLISPGIKLRYTPYGSPPETPALTLQPLNQTPNFSHGEEKEARRQPRSRLRDHVGCEQAQARKDCCRRPSQASRSGTG